MKEILSAHRQFLLFIYILGVDTRDRDLHNSVTPTSAGLGIYTGRCSLDICDNSKNSFPSAGVQGRAGGRGNGLGPFFKWVKGRRCN